MATKKTTVKTITIEVDEVEHEGDLRQAIADVNAAGGRVVKTRCNRSWDEDADETGFVVVETYNVAHFLKRFAATESGQFARVLRA